MGRAKVLVSASVTCYINGNPYGQISSFSYTISTNKTPVFALDSSEAYEIIPTTASLSGSMSIYRLIGDGGAEGAGISVFFDQLPIEKYFTMQFRDRSTDTVLFQSDRCMVNSQSWNVPAKGIVQGQVSFTAIDWSSEARTS